MFVCVSLSSLLEKCNFGTKEKRKKNEAKKTNKEEIHYAEGRKKIDPNQKHFNTNTKAAWNAMEEALAEEKKIYWDWEQYI